MIIPDWRNKIKDSKALQAMKLTSSQVKLYSSLQHKKYRRQYKMFIADGLHLVEDALKSDWQIEKVVVVPDTIDMARELKVPAGLLALAGQKQFSKISPSQTPQGILAIIRIPDQDDRLPHIMKTASRLIACDNISDPGNLGTIIRTAAAFGFDAVILIGNCADIYNPKVVRATQGALFLIPINEQPSSSRFVNDFKGIFELAILSNRAHKFLSSAPELTRPLLIVGGEATGISPEIEAAADYRFKIEQSGKIDSLNVSVVAGIAMYKFMST